MKKQKMKIRAVCDDMKFEVGSLRRFYACVCFLFEPGAMPLSGKDGTYKRPGVAECLQEWRRSVLVCRRAAKRATGLEGVTAAVSALSLQYNLAITTLHRLYHSVPRRPQMVKFWAAVLRLEAIRAVLRPYAVQLAHGARQAVKAKQASAAAAAAQDEDAEDSESESEDETPASASSSSSSSDTEPEDSKDKKKTKKKEDQLPQPSARSPLMDTPTMAVTAGCSCGCGVVPTAGCGCSRHAAPGAATQTSAKPL